MLDAKWGRGRSGWNLFFRDCWMIASAELLVKPPHFAKVARTSSGVKSEM
jgi:hypothetical protein